MPVSSKIVAIGDIHGSYKGLINNLKRVKLIDSNLNWIANDTRLIQIGDIFDRGNESLKSLKFLYSIREKARTFGGDVYFLYGNHEEMLLHGQSWYSVLENGYSSINDYINDLSPRGRIGKEIIESHNLSIIINGILFVHGGFMADWLRKYYPNKTTLAELNQTAKTLFLKDDRDHSIFNVGRSRGGTQIPGPLWADYYDDLCGMTENDIDYILNYFNAERMIVGHTPIMDNKVEVSYNNKVINIDLGLLPAYGGYEAVLVIEGRNIKAVYEDREEIIN